MKYEIDKEALETLICHNKSNSRGSFVSSYVSVELYIAIFLNALSQGNGYSTEIQGLENIIWSANEQYTTTFLLPAYFTEAVQTLLNRRNVCQKTKYLSWQMREPIITDCFSMIMATNPFGAKLWRIALGIPSLVP